MVRQGGHGQICNTCGWAWDMANPGEGDYLPTVPWVRRHKWTMPDGNPWLSIGQDPPYIAKTDRLILDEEHRRKYKLHCEVLPHSWVGNPLTARVVLLQLNPGWAPADWTDEQTYPEYTQLTRRSLNLDPAAGFYLLDAALEKTGGGRYWRQRLRPLIEASGEDAVRSGLAVLEYFPYHSETYVWPPMLPSQAYGFGLVRRAIYNGSIIVVMRQWELWRAAVPELLQIDGGQMCRNPNPRQGAVSPGNLGTSAFDKIVSGLQSI